MPIILKPETMETETTGEGWTKITLADRYSLGTSAIAAHRWVFEPFTIGPEQKHSGADELIYVISGSGTMRVNDDRLPLEWETVVWVEQGDIFQFLTTENALEVLQGFAPGE